MTLKTSNDDTGGVFAGLLAFHMGEEETPIAARWSSIV